MTQIEACVFCGQEKSDVTTVVLLNRRLLCNGCADYVVSAAKAAGQVLWKLDWSWSLLPFIAGLLLLGFASQFWLALVLALSSGVVFLCWQLIRYFVILQCKRWLSKRQWKVEENKIRDICSLWPEYPPDWEWRRQRVVRRDGFRCSECGVAVGVSTSSEEFTQSLKDRLQKRPHLAYGYPSMKRSGEIIFHVHHRKKFRVGDGDHRIENLTTLCEHCHGLQPGHQHLNSDRTHWQAGRRARGFRRHLT